VFVFVGGGIAALVGSLGCVTAGVGGVIAMTMGVIVVTPLAFAGLIRSP
jgi:hypothetical protein